MLSKFKPVFPISYFIFLYTISISHSVIAQTIDTIYADKALSQTVLIHPVRNKYMMLVSAKNAINTIKYLDRKIFYDKDNLVVVQSLMNESKVKISIAMTFWLLRNGLVEIGIGNRVPVYRRRIQDNTLQEKLSNDIIEMNEHYIQVRTMNPNDWQHVARIYQEGIDTGNATFQQEVSTWDDWDNSHLRVCRIIAEVEHQIAGWAALSPVSKRKVYSGVGEVTIYISNRFRNRGLGTTLFEHLISASEKENFWTLQAGIFPENKSSLKIHEKLGFRRVGFREKIGKMNGIRRDTVLLERRSLFQC